MSTDPAFVPFEPGRSVGHIVDQATGCWNFVGTLDKKGYGQIHTGPHRWSTGRAHRVYYARVHGPLPAAVQLDHTCRNRRCVNPVHLEPVTNAVNAQRGSRAKLTADLVRQLRAEYNQGGISFRTLAARHGFKETTVQLAVTGLNWKDVA